MALSLVSSILNRWMLMYFFVVFLNLTLCMTKLRVLVLCFSYSIIAVTKLCSLFTLSGSKRGRPPNSPSPPPPVVNSSCSINPIEHAPYILHTLHTYQVIRRWECNTRVQNCALPTCRQKHLCRLLLLLCRERTSHSHALVLDHKTHKRESGRVRSRETD